MNNLERLRPEAQPFDAEWSASTLQRIFASPPPMRNQRGAGARRLGLAAGVGVAVFGVGGAAFAAGLVPASVTDFFSNTSPTKVSDVHALASFTTSDDSGIRTFDLWRGTNGRGQDCTAVVEAGASGGPDFGGNCGDYPTDAWFNTTNESYAGTIDDPMPPSTYYVYGEPELAGVAQVRVVGRGFDHLVPVDEATGGYAVAVPEIQTVPSGRFAVVEFLDTDGRIIGTQTLSEK